jgi:hypothetical protein
MTVRESLISWLTLQRAYEWQLEKTRHLFEHERQKALGELQSRLLRLIG